MNNFQKKKHLYEKDLEDLVLSKFEFTKQIFKLKFDKTRLKSVDETVVFQPEKRVQFIMPLISLSGLICLS